MKNILFFSTFLIWCVTGFAQINSSWSANMSGQILWQEVTPLGNLLVATSQGLYGINPASGEPVWELPELANIGRDQFQNIPNSTFASVNKGHAVYIIEPMEGLIAFNSENTDLVTVTGQYFLYKHNGILVVGKTEMGKDLLVMVGMNSGKVFWDLSEDFGRIIAVEEITEEEILLVNLFHVYMIKSKTGEIVWKNATSSQTASLDKLGAFGSLIKSAAEEMSKDMDFDLSFYNAPDQSLYYLAFTKKQESTFGENTTVSFKNVYTAYELSTGDQFWDDPLELNGKVGQVVLQENGLLIMPDGGNKTKINLIDYKSKEGKWGKKGNGIPIKGGVYDYLELEEGILVVTKTDNNNFLNFLDPDVGMMTFEKSVKIKGRLVGSFKTDKGVFFITDEQLNVLDTQTGELLLGKSFKTKPELTAQIGDLIYAFDLKEGVVKKVNVVDASVSNVNNDKIKMEGNESVTGIELRENGIFIKSDQNVVMVGYDGNVVYQDYYQAPRESGWKRALMYAQAIRASLISAQAYYTSGVMQVAQPYVSEENTTAGQIVGELGDVYNELGNVASSYASSAFRAAGNRFKATSEGRDFQIILTQLKDKTIALAKVNKDTGEIINYIDLGKDKEPVYAVDDVLGTVFLKTSGSMIECYEF